MSGLLSSDVWLLVILAVVLAAIWIASCQSSGATAKLAAFFEVLGDALSLLALWCGAAREETVSG